MSVAKGKDRWQISCFACGFSGNTPDVVMALDNVTIAEALRKLGAGTEKRESEPVDLHRVDFVTLACDKCGFETRVEGQTYKVPGRCGRLWMTTPTEEVFAATSHGWEISANADFALCPKCLDRSENPSKRTGSEKRADTRERLGRALWCSDPPLGERRNRNAAQIAYESNKSGSRDSRRDGEVFVAIVGSRGYADMSIVRSFVRSLPAGTVVVSGAGKARRDRLPRSSWGVDEHAEDEAERCGLKVISHPAEWEKYGKSAGYRRNPLIIRDGNVVHAFWDGRSRGTKNSLDIARRMRKLTFVYDDVGNKIQQESHGTPGRQSAAMGTEPEPEGVPTQRT